jgi:hypothetical protein
MCFVWISEQTAIISVCSINWLVFITETECVYCAVRVEYLYIYIYIPPGLTFTNSTFCPHSVFMCFVWISEKTAIISLYSINWLVFIIENECVYCAVQMESLYICVYIMQDKTSLHIVKKIKHINRWNVPNFIHTIAIMNSGTVGLAITNKYVYRVRKEYCFPTWPTRAVPTASWVFIRVPKVIIAAIVCVAPVIDC